MKQEVTLEPGLRHTNLNELTGTTETGHRETKPRHNQGDICKQTWEQD